LVLQPLQSRLLKEVRSTTVVVKIDDGLVIPLENNNGKILRLLYRDFALVTKRSGPMGNNISSDRFWEKEYKVDSNWLVDLSNGKWKLLDQTNSNSNFWFSPSGNYLICFDPDRDCHYYCYNLKTGTKANISFNVAGRQLEYNDKSTEEKSEQPAGLAAWLEKKEEGLLVYDNNDIWQLDLSGVKPAVNLTNGFGRLHDIIFSLFDSHRLGYEIPILSSQKLLLLRAFNSSNKQSGFYSKRIEKRGNPELLSIGKYFINFIQWCHDPNLSKMGMKPVKASNSSSWIVQRQSDAEAPNYYTTTDFKTYKKLTDFQPQKKYNWLTEELHSFQHLDGKTGQGILYRPENFDSTKKYPVLIVFYGGYSNNMYQYPDPAFETMAISPGKSPIWFLNNGYLVFTPDIYTSPINPGLAAFNVIEGAANYLNTLPYVNPGKLGCASHSWSGRLGSYIFTHSKSFAAISISDAFAYGNIINLALSMDGVEHSFLETIEDQFKYGSLWENKNSWLDQTTVLNVDRANSPLLLFSYKRSSQSLGEDQTRQLFIALRRLGKKVWCPKYDIGGHTLDDLLEQKDYTIRYTQFLDHYLKDAPAPRWMTRGIPASMKGIDMGYELDPSGTCALNKNNDCPICKKWNEQYKRTPAMFTKPIAEWQLDKDLADDHSK
jgi:hypothetical protein